MEPKEKGQTTIYKTYKWN